MTAVQEARFKPVYLPPERALNGRGSQTLLRHYSACPRSGYLYQSYKGGGASTGEMQRGKAIHLVHERAVRVMLEEGERAIPAELVKTLADEVLAELHVPWAEHDYIREMAFRLGSEIAVDPEAVIAAETLFVLDVPVPETGEVFEVRCRIDFAELLEAGAVVHVEDYKSSKAAAPYDEVARKRPDGSWAAKAFQLVLYAIVLAYGVPVREEACGECGGAGEIAGDDHPAAFAGWCPFCEGKGRIEIREPFPVASRAQRFDCEFVYPGIENQDGKMLRRPVTITRPELEQYRTSLAGLVGQLLESERSGEWPAIVTDAGCGECPASLMCPIPKELKDHRGTVNTVAEAAEALEVRDREAKVSRAKTTELRKFVEQHGDVRYGGKVAFLETSFSQEIRDKDGMWAALERTRRYGEPFEAWRWVKEKVSTSLKTRDLTQDEMSEGSSDGR